MYTIKKGTIVWLLKEASFMGEHLEDIMDRAHQIICKRDIYFDHYDSTGALGDYKFFKLPMNDRGITELFVRNANVGWVCT